MAIIDLPYQDIIDQRSGPTKQGYDLKEVRYSGKVSQRAFNGPNVAASKIATWKIIWSHLVYDKDNTPEYDLQTLFDFERLSQVNDVRYQPLEYDTPIVWRVIDGSFNHKNVAGNIFTVEISLEYLYQE